MESNHFMLRCMSICPETIQQKLVSLVFLKTMDLFIQSIYSMQDTIGGH